MSPRLDGDTVQWDAQFQELKKYKAEHGHCNVPQRHGLLGNWVNTQHQCYLLLKEVKSSRISDEYN